MLPSIRSTPATTRAVVPARPICQALKVEVHAGLQIQKNESEVTTIEAELGTALVRAGRVLDSNVGAHHKMGWSRSSRTDKGVHSLATVRPCPLLHLNTLSMCLLCQLTVLLLENLALP